MGYFVTQSKTHFNVSAANIPAMIQAIRTLAHNTDDMSGARYNNGVKTSSHYSWVNMSFADLDSVKDIFNCWRWSVEIDEQSGDITDICFEKEKLGDDFILFKAIAPYVKDGSYIEMIGEDNELWRWSFKDGTCREISPKITWDE